MKKRMLISAKILVMLFTLMLSNKITGIILVPPAIAAAHIAQWKSLVTKTAERLEKDQPDQETQLLPNELARGQKIMKQRGKEFVKERLSTAVTMERERIKADKKIELIKKDKSIKPKERRKKIKEIKATRKNEIERMRKEWKNWKQDNKK